MKRKYLGDSQSDIEKINKKAFILNTEYHERKYDNNIFTENKRFRLMKKESIINELKELNINQQEDVNLDDFSDEDEIPSIKINHQDSNILNFDEESLEDRMYSLEEVVSIMRQYESNVIREFERNNIRDHVKKHDLEGLNIY